MIAAHKEYRIGVVNIGSRSFRLPNGRTGSRSYYAAKLYRATARKSDGKYIYQVVRQLTDGFTSYNKARNSGIAAAIGIPFDKNVRHGSLVDG